MRNAALILVIALGACGPTGGATTKRPEPPTPPPPAYTVAHGDYITLVAADATHVYWVDGGILRHPHGATGKTERLWASDAGMYFLGVGAEDVFFVDDSNILRALPKIGGAPSELTTFDGQVWGLYADGNGVWVGVDDRLERWSREPHQKKIALPHPGNFLAVADHVAYVTSYEGGTLVSVDLKTRKVTELSTEPVIRQAFGLGVSGKSVLIAYSEGVAAIPRTGGPAQITFATPTSAITADRDGYVVFAGNAIVEHRHGQAPRVVASSDFASTLGAYTSLALGGGYVYHVDYDSQRGGSVLHGSPRDAGAIMLRLPLGSTVNDLTVDGEQVYAAIDDTDGAHIARVGTRRTQLITDATSYVDRVISGDGVVAFSTDAGLLTSDPKGSRQPVEHSTDGAGTPPLAVHKGMIYWVTYMQIWAVPIAQGGRPVLVADASSIPDVAGDLQISAIEFTADHLYFTLPLVGLQGLASVDEHHHVEMVWTYSQYTGDVGSLSSDFTIIDDTAYAHDANHIYAIPLDGGDARTLHAADDEEVSWVDNAGTHLVAWIRGPEGDELVDIDRSTGKAHRLWRSYLDGGTPYVWDVGPDAVYLLSTELQAILKVPIQNDQPIERP